MTTTEEIIAESLLAGDHVLDTVIRMVDNTMKSCGNTNTVASSEMLDALLDIRNTLLIIKGNQPQEKKEITA